MSGNLINWIPVTNIFSPDTNELFQFVDWNATNYKSLFYRTRRE